MMSNDSPYGKIPNGWQLIPLKEVCVFDNGIQTGPFGSQLHQKDYVDVGTPIITVEHLGENRILHDELPRVKNEDRKRLNRYSLRKDDIVFSRVGSVDRRALVREEEDGWLFSGRCLRIRPDGNKINPSFLSWFFGLPTFKDFIRRIAVGATMPSLNTELLSNIPIFLPPMKEQERIAGILNPIDDKIELNHRMNQTLEEMAKAIFKSWFVDFDPVRANKGCDDTSLPVEIAALFPDSFEESIIGMIPRGWKVVALPEVLEIDPFRHLKKDQMSHYLDMHNMPTIGHRVLGWTSRQYISGTRFENGDTLMARITPCLENGKTAFVDFLKDGEVGWGSTEYIVFRSRQPLPIEYSYYLARDDSFRAFSIKSMSGTSGRQRVQLSSFQNYKIAIAPTPILDYFGRLAHDYISIIKRYSEEIYTLTQLRNLLLPKLINGEIVFG
jgi:type I restriction enzyme, S subunit